MLTLKLPIIELTVNNPPDRILKTRGLTLPDFLLAHVKIPARMQWTASSVRMFRSCPRKFFWKYILRLRPHADAGKDVNLVIGGAFHHCLAKWYTHRRSAMKKIVAPFQRRLDSLLANNALQCRDQKDYDKIETTVNTFTGMMLGYEHAYHRDRERWSIPRDCVEKVFVADCGDFDYTGKIDIVPSLDTLEFIVEHKSASRVAANEAYLDRLTLDIQVRGYIFGARKGLGIPAVNEVLYDVVMKSMLRRKSNESQDTFNQRIVDDYTSRQQHYFHREPLRFPRAAINEFELELRQVHADYQRIVWPISSRLAQRKLSHKRDFIKMLADAGMMPAKELAENPSDPRAWRPDDSTCNDYFRLCEYYPCCTDGLTQSVSRSFTIGEHMHEELHDE